MGKIFPLITNLKERPSCFEKTIKLIEKSFQYETHNSFQIDFAPLIDESNHQNCFIIIDEHDSVLAHIGAKQKNIILNGHSFPVTMLGGIAVEEKFRGQGLFQMLFQDVIAEKRSDTTFFLLWSDQEKLYQKYGFYLCGDQYEFESPHNPLDVSFQKTTYSNLSNSQKETIQLLYRESFQKYYVTPERTESDWKILELLTSSEIYLEKSEGEIISYFFQGKGQDLDQIIFEYGSKKDLPIFLKEISKFGKVWMGHPWPESESHHYQFMMCPGDTKLFSHFIHSYTNGLISLRDINPMKQEAYFDFNQETLLLSVDEFMKGIFGPGPFEELGKLKPLFISGLDSI